VDCGKKEKESNGLINKKLKRFKEAILTIHSTTKRRIAFQCRVLPLVLNLMAIS